MPITNAPALPGAAPLVPANRGMNPIDRILGRAAVDAEFQRQLLSEPAVALKSEPAPVWLVAILTRVRAASFAEYVERVVAAWEDTLAGRVVLEPEEPLALPRPAAPIRLPGAA